MTFVICPQRPPRLFECRTQSNTGHHVEQCAFQIVARIPGWAGPRDPGAIMATIESDRIGGNAAMKLGGCGDIARAARSTSHKADVIRRHDRHATGSSQRDQLAVEALLVGIKMALHIDKEIARAKNSSQPIA